MVGQISDVYLLRLKVLINRTVGGLFFPSCFSFLFWEQLKVLNKQVCLLAFQCFPAALVKAHIIHWFVLNYGNYYSSFAPITSLGMILEYLFYLHIKIT